MFHNPASKEPHFFARVIGVPECDYPIPHSLWFIHEHNILESKEPQNMYQAVRRTAHRFKYRALNGNAAEVHFLDYAACREHIRQAENALVPYFDKETKSEYKADSCRLAALYLHGGFYFDVSPHITPSHPSGSQCMAHAVQLTPASDDV
jgi:hypothetical protein